MTSKPLHAFSERAKQPGKLAASGPLQPIRLRLPVQYANAQVRITPCYMSLPVCVVMPFSVRCAAETGR